jgi:hypothetical protein
VIDWHERLRSTAKRGGCHRPILGMSPVLLPPLTEPRRSCVLRQGCMPQKPPCLIPNP